MIHDPPLLEIRRSFPRPSASAVRKLDGFETLEDFDGVRTVGLLVFLLLGSHGRTGLLGVWRRVVRQTSRRSRNSLPSTTDRTDSAAAFLHT